MTSTNRSSVFAKDSSRNY